MYDVEIGRLLKLVVCSISSHQNVVKNMCRVRTSKPIGKCYYNIHCYHLAEKPISLCVPIPCELHQYTNKHINAFTHFICIFRHRTQTQLECHAFHFTIRICTFPPQFLFLVFASFKFDIQFVFFSCLCVSVCGSYILALSFRRTPIRLPR